MHTIVAPVDVDVDGRRRPVRYAARGVHWLVDCHGVAADRLADAAFLETMLCGAADDAGATRLFRHFHRFGAGAGVTGVVLLAESHITIHTWPEQAFAAIDLFLCGATRADLALSHIERELAPERIVTVLQQRGERV